MARACQQNVSCDEARQQPDLGLSSTPMGPDPTSVRELALGFTVPKDSSFGVLIPGASTLLKKRLTGFQTNFTVSLNTVVLWHYRTPGRLPEVSGIRCYSPSQVAEGLLLSWLRASELPGRHTEHMALSRL